MGMFTKVALVLAAIIVIGGGAYYLAVGPQGSVLDELQSMTNSLSSSEGAGGEIPPANDSLDDFGAAMEAELNADASAVNALDTDVNASVDTIVTGSQNTYDPQSI